MAVTERCLGYRRVWCVAPIMVLICLALVVGVAYGERSLTICSFNIDWLGQYQKDNAVLCNVVRDCDIVLVQELVAPPYADRYPDGSALKPDPESALFFDTMASYGFAPWLSEEDTGPGTTNHDNSARTEWPVAFYKPDVVQTAPNLPHGFLAADRSANPCYDRVPYAFSFRTCTGEEDFGFVLVSVHLHATEGDSSGQVSQDQCQRRLEMTSICLWINDQLETKKDFTNFAIVGDVNAENPSELCALWAGLLEDAPIGLTPLSCGRPTNVCATKPKPYDNAFVSDSLLQRIDWSYGFQVGDLKQAICDGDASCQSATTVSSRAYSNHNPIYFRLRVP